MQNNVTIETKKTRMLDPDLVVRIHRLVAGSGLDDRRLDIDDHHHGYSAQRDDVE